MTILFNSLGKPDRTAIISIYIPFFFMYAYTAYQLRVVLHRVSFVNSR